jgi:predicted O-methyltransferase YrrM
VRTGGYILIDNVLWSGKVLQKNRKKLDKDTESMLEFNEFVHQDDSVQNVLFPIRDGLMILRKK